MKKSNLDEMQELELLKIEHNGCWLVFWGLLAAIVIQSLLGMGWKAIVGEWILFMILSIYLGVACVRSGIWDRRLKMDLRTNLLFSLAAGVCGGGFTFAYTWLRYHKAQGSFAAASIMGACCFVICFIALQLAARATKKRQKQLNAEPEEE